MRAMRRVDLEAFEAGRYFPNTTRTNEALTIINPAMAQVFNGQLTARQAGEKLRTDVDATLRG